MTYTDKRLEEQDWKAESYKKWRATDLAEQCKPWEGAVHQYFVNEIIGPLLATSITQALAEERKRVRGEIENKRADLRREMRKLDYEGEDYLDSPVDLGHCYLKRLEDLKEVKDDILSSLDR